MAAESSTANSQQLPQTVLFPFSMCCLETFAIFFINILFANFHHPGQNLIGNFCLPNPPPLPRLFARPFSPSFLMKIKLLTPATLGGKIRERLTQKDEEDA